LSTAIGRLPLLSRVAILQRGSQSAFLLGSWNHKISDDNEFELKGFANYFHIKSGPRWTDYLYHQAALEFGHRFSPVDDHTIRWGIDGRWDYTDASNADPFMLERDTISTAIIGVHVQHDWHFAPKWGLNLGGRIDYDSYGGFEPSGRAALSYRPNDDSIIYGAVARTYRMPSAGFRFIDHPIGPIVKEAIRITSNQSVDPESHVSFELGYRGRLFDRIDVGAGVYWGRYKDLVMTSPALGPPGYIQLISDNGSAARSYGAELEFEAPINDLLTILGHYTFQRFDSTSTLLGAGNISPPEHKFMIGGRYDLTDDLRLSGNLFYVADVEAPSGALLIPQRHISPYFRLDLRAEHELWDDQASIAIGVRNLLDSNHAEGGAPPLDDAEVPRMIYAELRLKLR
jgi:outer membrane receptor protein involved in Fe transport